MAKLPMREDVRWELPTREDVARTLADAYQHCQSKATEADSVGATKEVEEWRALAAKVRKQMEQNGIRLA